ncbi:MAG: hypothetical protein HY700_05090 [Gemmatimonadetes bacterium]|nr:hypothetical protein [Gemmatimonadota bacterium]
MVLWGIIGRDRKAIAKAETEAAALAAVRDSLTSVVDEREQLISTLGLHSDSLESLAQSWRDSVGVLERNRETAQLAIRETTTLTGLAQELRRAFPELGDSVWRMLTIPAGKNDTLGIQYVAVPAWFAETFVIDHQNAASWRQQKDRLLAADSLQLLVTALQDSIVRLEDANSSAYATGYETAFSSYQRLSNQYVRALQEPRFKLGSSVGFVATAAAGFILGRALR